MNWDDLRVFLAVARVQRLEAAARQTGLDSTTVARRIGRLEQALGTVLFEHSRTGHQLTAAGQRLVAHAEASESAALAARSELTGAAGELGGSVRVSVAEGFGTWLVARHLQGFHAQHPGVTVEIVASNGFLNPSRREADLAVVFGRPARGPLVAKRLTDYRLRLYASRDYLDHNGAPAAPADLKAHVLVGYIPDLLYAPELNYLGEVAPDLNPTLRSTSLNAQAGIIASGAGIGVLPCFIGDQLPGLVPVLSPPVEITRSFWLVVHKDARRLSRVDAFIRWLGQLMDANREALLGSAAAAAALDKRRLAAL